MYSIKNRSMKVVFAGAAVALALPLSALAGHDNFLRELARTEGDASGAHSHLEVSNKVSPSTKSDRSFLLQLAGPDGHVGPLDTAPNAPIKAPVAASGKYDAMSAATAADLRRFADSNGGA